MPRSGTTWLASILNTAKDIKYFYEPFNKDHIPEAALYWNKYLRAEEENKEFSQFCQAAFTGKLTQKSYLKTLKFPYKVLQGNLRWLPGRVMVKDVHSTMSLEWIDMHIAPIIIILMRHPCAMVASWLRTFKPAFETGNVIGLQRLLEQPKLCKDYLQPFEDLLQKKGHYWQKVAHYWGAAHYVMLKQQQQHPDWMIIQHEQLCLDPENEFRKIFDKLQLHWTKKTDQLLKASTTFDSLKSYIPSRITAQEAEKWKQQLIPNQIKEIMDAVKPFNIPYYINND